MWKPFWFESNLWWGMVKGPEQFNDICITCEYTKERVLSARLRSL